MHTLILNLLLSAALLAHSVLGCCWHHGHGQGCAEETAALASHCHADHASHEGDADHHGSPSLAVCDSHDHSTACDEPDCSFVKTGAAKVLLDQPTALAVLLTPASVSAPARHLLDRAAAHGSAQVSGAELRALLQVWLT